MRTERLESMSPRGWIALMRQDDGDIVVSVAEDDGNGSIRQMASIEICTPFTGGGGSSRTWEALIQLMGAMAADNLDASQNGRRPPAGIYEDEQRRILEWAEQCRQVHERERTR